MFQLYAGLSPTTTVVVYPYASQGIKCQESNMTIVTSSGGTPACLDLLGPDTRDGAAV